MKNALEGLLQKDAHFYLLYTKDPQMTTSFNQVLSLRNSTRTLLQEVQFDKLGLVIDHIDMEGVTLISNTLSWAPYFIIENCDELGQNCDLSGFLADYMDALCRILNCTWTSHAPPDGSWGVRPISGPFNKSGVWGGAMGGVVNGDFHISLSQWVWNVERYGLLDFVSTSTNFVVLGWKLIQLTNFYLKKKHKKLLLL